MLWAMTTLPQNPLPDLRPCTSAVDRTHPSAGAEFQLSCPYPFYGLDDRATALKRIVERIHDDILEDSAIAAVDVGERVTTADTDAQDLE
jgi:hypothetical protein